MGMTRRDYELLASIMRQQIDRKLCRDDNDRKADPNMAGLTALYMAARALANRLAEDNPRFDKVRFLTASGVIS